MDFVYHKVVMLMRFEIISISVCDCPNRNHFLELKKYLDVIRIPYIRQWINLTNDSVHCIDKRSYDAKAILTM